MPISLRGVKDYWHNIRHVVIKTVLGLLMNSHSRIFYASSAKKITRTCSIGSLCVYVQYYMRV